MYFCNKCVFSTTSKYNYERHCSSLKHIKLFNIKKDASFVCSTCEKKYKYQSGFYRHTKFCNKPIKELSEIELLQQKYEIKMKLERLKNKSKLKEIESQLNSQSSNQPNLSNLLNNQLIDIILSKNKVIEELKTNGSQNQSEQNNEVNKTNNELLNIIKMQEEKIKLLEDLCIRKQKRQSFPEKNVIYIVTTEENKKNRIYIIGKAKDLKNRLSTYNKTAEHEVVYYKGCDEDDLKVIEQNVLRKLRNYREKANRDRFVLPIEKEISFFTEIIDQCINDIKDC